MDQTALVMALHGFGNVIDNTCVACARKFVSVNAAKVKFTLRQQATPSFHSTFKKLFSGLFTKEPYTANQALPKKERRDLGYYRGPTKGHARMGEKVKEYADEFKEDWNAPAVFLFPNYKIGYSLRDSPGTFAEKKNDKRFPHTACITAHPKTSFRLPPC